MTELADRPADHRGANTAEIVAAGIRGHIQARGLTPGDRLGKEADLAAQFGVSRPTLREALRLLSSAHLIRASKGPGGGIFVAATPEEGIGRTVSDTVADMLRNRSIDADELIETRLLLEVPLAGLAAQQAGDADVAALNALIEELERDIGRLNEIDARVHHMLAVIGGNRLAAAFTGWIVDVAQPELATLIAPVVVEEVVVDQHRELARAISRGDPLSAERAMREHLVYLRDLVATVRREGGPEGS